MKEKTAAIRLEHLANYESSLLYPIADT